MAHLRKQIREGIAAALAGLPTTGANVFQSRVYPLEDTDLPALQVYALGDTALAVSLPAPRLMERRLRVNVVAVAKAVDNLDDTLDQICEEAEQALAMPCAELAGLCKSITLVATDIEMQGTAERPVGQAAMTYEVYYLNAENAPDVAL
jgi:hypothetical protein